jgi:hypothetical protein
LVIGTAPPLTADMTPREGATARAAGGTSGVGGVRGSEEAGDDESECDGEGGDDSGVPVVYEMLGRLVGTDDAADLTLTGGTDDADTGAAAGEVVVGVTGEGATPVFNPPVP